MPVLLMQIRQLILLQALSLDCLESADGSTSGDLTNLRGIAVFPLRRKQSCREQRWRQGGQNMVSAWKLSVAAILVVVAAYAIPAEGNCPCQQHAGPCVGSGMWCCPGPYCSKPLPCPPCRPACCCDCYCRKPLPCPPPCQSCLWCPDNYCRKPLPCPPCRPALCCPDKCCRHR